MLGINFVLIGLSIGYQFCRYCATHWVHIGSPRWCTLGCSRWCTLGWGMVHSGVGGGAHWGFCIKTVCFVIIFPMCTMCVSNVHRYVFFFVRNVHRSVFFLGPNVHPSFFCVPNVHRQCAPPVSTQCAPPVWCFSNLWSIYRLNILHNACAWLKVRGVSANTCAVIPYMYFTHIHANLVFVFCTSPHS